VSAIGEFLREMMPAWLSPLRRDRWAVRQGRNVAGDDPRELAREADAVWRQCVDEGQHGEAFPEDAAEKRWRRGSAGDRRKRPAGSNGPH